MEQSTAPRPKIVLVVARADNGVIGQDGKLPWHLPADLRHFKRVTMGASMVMGRRTFESLPGLLSGRRHIVLTRNTGWHAEGAETVRSVEEAIAAADGPALSVVGGADIFALFLPLAERIELTEVHIDAEGDTRIPPFDPDVWCPERVDHHPAQGGLPAFTFVTLKRR